jgi:hypothetical protein
MAAAADVRRLALALDGTTAHPHFDRTAFKVRRNYATLAGDGRSLNLRLTPEEQEFKTLLAPEIFAAVPNKWGAAGWTTVDLARIPLPDLEAALRLAWTHASAKRAQRQ